MERLHPAPDFRHQLAKVDLGVDDLVKLIGEDNINRTTVYAWTHPNEARRPTSIRERKAWRVARAYAQHTGITPEEAFSRLFVVIEQTPA
jgi:hypothetical protein